MKFLIDLNLSPDWMDVLTVEGWEACSGAESKDNVAVPLCFYFAGDRWADVTE